ncbi:TraE/TraK family type IV conjugative transfer system protein [Sulfurimonas sp.]
MFKIKAGEEYEGQLEKNFEVNKILWRVSVLQTIIICALVVGYLQLKETVYVGVELPSKIYTDNGETIKKGVDWASKNYYQVWGRSLVEEASSFDVDTISSKMADIEKMMRPSVAVKKDAEIQKYVKAVINNRLSQKFEILKSKTISLSKTQKEITYTGISKPKVGNKEIKPKECKYVIDLKLYQNGVLYVENFGTDCL